MSENRTYPARAIAICAALIWAGATEARPDLCEAAAATAAEEYAVPVELMRAVTLAETGRRLGTARRPWPWAVNRGGDGRWFDTADLALAHTRAAIAEGARNIDIGCFQLNLHWHGDAFASLEQMFDPLANARHAARFLRDLHRETGDWLLAAGAYHSRTPDLAERYRTRVAAILAELDPLPPPPPPTSTSDPGRPGRGYPLLQAAAAGRNGSLVPGGLAARPLLAGPRARLIGG